MEQTTESFLKIEAVFHAVLDHAEGYSDPASRSALISSLCDGDTTMVAEVESLLSASEAEEQQTTARLTGSGANTSGANGGLPERKRIGPYELDRLLGRGGMGAVYLASRVDGQFDQQVAIKLIDLPLATDLFRERFRQERQILAGLNHPFIARLLDGGVTSDGDLYLAMEFVDGMPISRYCNEQKLSIEQRLGIFKSVCEAVQFAHQNLVVHRDLKPDNILVAEDGTPRLLDFGTAKLLSPSLENLGSEFTRQGFQSFTPQYASPEQVLGNPITTASDTYSLGVLLYLLLTGVPPYELKELTTAEMIRVICQEPPRKIATAVQSNLPLDADLEAILMKALRKEPTERYLTAEQFSADIQDYLDGRPVAARRGTFRYRASKFIRRNRLSLAGAALLLITLTAGLAGVLWQATVANNERRKAEARSADLRELSNSLLSELDEAIKQLPGSTGVQKLLVTRVLEHLDRMAKDAQGDRPTQLDLIDAYTRLGKLQGDPYDQNLGDAAGGLQSVDKALSIASQINSSQSGKEPQWKDHDAALALATAEVAKSEILFGIGRTPEAVTSMQQAVQVYDHLIAMPDATPILMGEAAAVYGSYGDELGQSGTASLANHEAALATYRKTLDLDNRILTIDPNFLRAKRGLAIIEMKIGGIELDTDPAQALKDYQLGLNRVEAISKSEQSSLPMQRLHFMLLRKKANALSELGEYSQADPIYSEILRYHQDLSQKDPQDLRALSDVEVILDDQALSDENAADPQLADGSESPAEVRKYLVSAQELFTELLNVSERMLKLDPENKVWKINVATAQVHLAVIEHRLNSSANVDALAQKGLATMRELASPANASAMSIDLAASAYLEIEPASLRDPKFALAAAERGVALTRRKVPSWLLLLAQAHHANGQLDQCHQVAKEALALLPAYHPGAPKSRIRKLLESEQRATV